MQYSINLGETVYRRLHALKNSTGPGTIIGDGDRKFWDPRGPMIWDNFYIFTTNCAILTSFALLQARAVGSQVYIVTLHDQK